MDIGGDLKKIISELQSEFQEFRQKQEKQTQKLIRENSQLKEKLSELEKKMPEKDAITASVLAKIDSKLSSIRKQMFKIKEFDSFLSKNEQFRYMIAHFSELDKMSLTKRQYAQFSNDVTRLRKEAAELISLKKQLQSLSKIENTLMRLSRKVPQLEQKLAPVK